MKNPPQEDEIKPGEEEEKGDETNQLNSPKLDEETGKPTKRAISTFKQAHGIAMRQYTKAKDGRFKTDATIADKYGGSPPFKNAHLKATGQDWRSNFCTNPLALVVDRSTPQLTDPIKAAEYLTYSSLPADRDGAADKTRKFRLRTTKLVRSWPGFVSMVGQVAQSTYIYGNAAPGWIDGDWRPRAFRRDETFIPEGTGQHASMAQFAVYRQPMLLHDFLQKIEDKEVAESAGYNWAGCVKAANEAAGIYADGDLSQLEQIDSMREGGALGFTHDGETKIVWMFHVLVREYGGGVNLWTVTQKGAHPVRFVENLHESMEDATCLFTLQEGNEKFHGSKGAGRSLTNIHIALDRHRNSGADKVYMAGLPIFKNKGKDMNSIQMSVRSPFIFINGDAEMLADQVSFDFAAHEYLDKSLSALMEATAGAFIPPNLDGGGSSNTKIEAAQKAERELAVKNGVLGRWFGHIANLMGGIQRKAYKPENLKEALRIYEENKAKKEQGIRVMARRIWEWLSEVVGSDKNSAPEEESKIADADAVQCIVDLLNDGLTIEDITEAALSPAGNNVEQQPEEQDNATVAFIDETALNPMLAQFINLKEAVKMKAEIRIKEDRANRLMLPDSQDPNIEAVAQRDQIQEWLAMSAGEAQPVASTDQHSIHRKTLIPYLTPVIQSLQSEPTQELSEVGKLSIQHYADHLAADTTASEDNKAKEMGSVEQWQKIIMDADKVLAKMAEEAQAAGVAPGSLPQSSPGVPMGAQPPDGELDREKFQAETILRGADQQIQHRKLDLEEKKLDQADTHHSTQIAVEAMRNVADKTVQAQQEGRQAAEDDAQAELDREAQKHDADKAKV